MSPKCPNCPISGPCHALPMVCDLTGDPAFLERYIAYLADLAAKRPTVAEAWDGLDRIKTCPYRSLFPPCGCSGARCGLRWGAIVSIHDCLDCVRDYGVS